MIYFEGIYSCNKLFVRGPERLNKYADELKDIFIPFEGFLLVSFVVFLKCESQRFLLFFFFAS